MVEDNFASDRDIFMPNRPDFYAFFFYYIIFFIKSQAKALEFDIFYYFWYNYNGEVYIKIKPQK